MIPSTWSAESGLMIAVAASLIARSISDIWMIQNATMIESTIIGMNKGGFRKALVKYFAALPAVSVLNVCSIQNSLIILNFRLQW